MDVILGMFLRLNDASGRLRAELIKSDAFKLIKRVITAKFTHEDSELKVAAFDLCESLVNG